MKNKLLTAQIFILMTALNYCSACVFAQTNKRLTTLQLYPLRSGEIIKDNDSDGKALINKMVEKSANLSNYSAEYTMFVYKPKKAQVEKGIFYFSKPKLLRIEVKEGERKGALAILAADGKIHGHMGGLMKYFKGAVSADSDFAKAINGFPMAGIDFYSLAAYLKNMIREGDSSISTVNTLKTKVVNKPTFILDMYKMDKENKPVLLKRVFVDPATYLPVYWEDYTDGKLWSQSIWQNIHFNANLPSTMFRS